MHWQEEPALSEQLAQMRQRLDTLYRRSQQLALPAEELKLLPEAFEELSIAAEELYVADEQLLRQSEALMVAHEAVDAQRLHYQDLFDCAPEVFLVTDTFGKIQEVNQAAAHLLGQPQHTFVGKPLFVYLAMDVRRFLRCELISILRSNEVGEWTLPLRLPGNRRIDAQIKAALLRDRLGRVRSLRWHIRPLAHEPQHLPPALKSSIEAEPVRLEVGRNVALALEPQTLYQVRQGLLKLSTRHGNGIETLVGLIGPGMLLGRPVSALSSYLVTTMTPVQLVGWPQAVVEANPLLGSRLLPFATRRLQQAEALLAIAGQQRTEDRLRQLLVVLRDEIGEPVEEGTCLSVRLTHEELAGLVGSARVTVTNLLRTFKQEGWLTLDSRRRIIVYDRKVKPL